MRRFLIIFVLLCFGQLNAAQVQIGGAALLTATTDQEYFSSGINRQPASNSVQRLNPPVFGWPYYENPALLFDSATTNYVETRSFNFQLTTNGSFASPLFNITISNNFYNFFQPITNADGSTWSNTVSWRVRYLNSNGSVALGTNPVHTFTMPANAEIWDRSCFGDQTFLNSFSNVHPRIIVKSTNLTAFRAFVHGPNLSDVIPNITLNTFLSTTSIITTAEWTNTVAMTNNFPTWVFLAGSIADLGVAFWGVTNAAFTNYIANASPSVATVLTNWCMQNETHGYDRVETYGGNLYGVASLGTCYDLFYQLMNDEQRAAVRRHMRNWAAFNVFEDWFFTGSSTNLDRIYGGRPLSIHYPSIAKQGESHMRHDRSALALILPIVGEDTMANYLLDYYLNYYIARFDPFNYSGEDPRIYGGISTMLDWSRSFQPWVLANMMFYDKKLTNAPVYNELADVLMFHTPTGHRVVGNPWGQVSCFCENIFAYNQNPWQYNAFAAFAAMQGRGDYYRQHLRSADASLGGGRIAEAGMYQAITAPFYWAGATQADRNTNSYVDPVRGWAMGLSGKPTDWDAYTNQVGFVFQARPTGTGRNSGGHFSDGSIEMWAYGATVTAAGGGQFGQAALMHNGLFVDGIGVNNASPAVTFPIHARFEAATNWGSGFYARADLTHAFNLSNYVGGGVGNLQSVPGTPAWSVSYLTASNARPYLTSAKRSVLSPGNLFHVIRDTFTATQAASFQFRWPSFPTNTTLFDTNTMSLNYQVTNNFTGFSNVTVLLKKIGSHSSVTYTQLHNFANLASSNANNYALVNPFTGERYDGTNNWKDGATVALKLWASTLWTYNRVPGTNWSDVTFIGATLGDTNAWVVTRKDNDTLGVTNTVLNIAELISYDTNNVTGGAGTYAGVATIVVDEGATNAPPSPPPAPPSLIQVSKTAGKMKLSGSARIQ